MGDFEFFVPQRNLKEWQERPCMFANVKGKQQKQVRRQQCPEQCIEHIPYYLSGLSRAQFFRQPFSK